MADRITDAETRLELVTRRLARRARVDMAGSVISAQSYEASVSGSGGSSATETSGLAQAQGLAWAGEHQTISKALEKAAELLEKTEESITPKATGQQCPTEARSPDGALVRCTGDVTHRGRCSDCDRDPRSRSGTLPAGTIAARNDRRGRWCDCPPECCARDTAGYMTCTERSEPGRKLSRKCRERLYRLRKAEAS